MFTDDTAVVSSGGTWDEVYEQASKDLIKVQSWMVSNSLSQNINKTNYLPMFLLNEDDPGNRVLLLQSCGEFTCRYGIIEWVDQYKYLRVIPYHKPNWSPHVQPYIHTMLN